MRGSKPESHTKLQQAECMRETVSVVVLGRAGCVIWAVHILMTRHTVLS